MICRVKREVRNLSGEARTEEANASEEGGNGLFSFQLARCKSAGALPYPLAGARLASVLRGRLNLKILPADCR